MRAIVEVEDQITTFEPADNGAGPLWCHGSTIVARAGDEVYVAGLETIAEAKPLNNTRWLLFRRAGTGGWQLVHRDETGRTREPSPIALLHGTDLLVSANPTLTAPDEYNGPARPEVHRFTVADPAAAPLREEPVWSGSPEFREHSYRTVTADGDAGQVLYLQNEGYAFAHMSLRTGGDWRGLGQITWPVQGQTYAGTPADSSGSGEAGTPLRLCYPNVMLRSGSAHYLGVGDIVEPVEAWRDAKKEITGRDWDYVFRRLFYASTPDVAGQPFGDWLELANRDATAGATRNCDLWVGADGTAHVLWIEISTDSRIRDRFFPDTELRQSLEYAAIRDGAVIERRSLAGLGADEAGLQPTLARFHAVADDEAVILAQFSERPSGDVRYRVAPLTDREPDWTDVPFQRPLPGTFLTSTVRGGTAPGPVIDLVGQTQGPALAYARVRLA